MKNKYTAEQNLVIHHPYELDHVVSVKAYAGCGKTTTLLATAQQIQRDHPTWKGLYLVYNTALKDEAKTKFPRTVRVLTTHGLAYPHTALDYKNAPTGRNQIVYSIQKDSRRYTLTDCLDMIMLGKIQCSPEVKKWALKATIDFNITNICITTVAAYTSSGDLEISEDHIDRSEVRRLGLLISDDIILTLSRALWTKMIDLNDHTPISPDTYIKLYQLRKPDLGDQYDFVMYDEAQDANGAVLDILRNSNLCKIYVGDPHQQIYGWRGGQNAFEVIKERQTHSYTLSMSFRFNPSIAQWASCVLYAWKEEEDPIKAYDNGGGIYFNSQKTKDLPRRTLICRTNARVFSHAVSCLQSDTPFCIEGDQDDILIDIYEIYLIYSNQLDKIKKNTHLVKYRNMEGVKRYAASAEEYPLMISCMICNNYGHKIPQIIRDIKTKSVASTHAKVILTTAHKSKGLEWQCVELDQDFLEMFRDTEGNTSNSSSDMKFKYLPVPVTKYSLSRTEEANLLYVAITRGIFLTYIPDNLGKMILDHHAYREDINGY